MRKVLFVLGDLHDEDLQWMIEAGSVEHVADGDVLIEKGAANNRLYIVIDGKMSVRHRASGGGELARLGIGDMAGDISLLDSRPAVASIVADGASRVFVLEHAALLAKMGRDTGFAARFYRAIGVFLANRLVEQQAEPLSADGPSLSENALDKGELAPEIMDSVNLSGARFLSFLSRLESI